MKTCRYAVLALLTALITLTCLPLSAQDTLAVKPGDRVRVTAPALVMDKHEDTLLQLRGDTLVFASTRCPLSDVTRLEAYRGRESRGATGFFLGGLIGASVGGFIGHWSHLARPWDLPHELCVAFGAVPGFLVGGFVGYRIGRRGRWEEVPLSRLLPSIQLEREGRFGITFSLLAPR